MRNNFIELILFLLFATTYLVNFNGQPFCLVLSITNYYEFWQYPMMLNIEQNSHLLWLIRLSFRKKKK